MSTGTTTTSTAPAAPVLDFTSLGAAVAAAETELTNLAGLNGNFAKVLLEDLQATIQRAAAMAGHVHQHFGGGPIISGTATAAAPTAAGTTSTAQA